MKVLLPALARPLLEPQLPPEIEPRWFMTPDEAKALIADVEVAWADMHPAGLVAEAIRAAGPELRWLSTIYAGMDKFPLDLLAERGIMLTNGAGVNAIAVAEYAVMGLLVAAKRYDEVVRIADRHEWSINPPGRIELAGTRALVIGYGTIGRLIGERLRGFAVEVTGVARTARDGLLGPDDWRSRLGEFDHIVLAAPSTGATKAMSARKNSPPASAARCSSMSRAATWSIRTG